MAVEAVISELVSVWMFPVSRESTAKIADLSFREPRPVGFFSRKFNRYQQNSVVTKAGKICGRTGKPKPHNSEPDSR